MTTTKPLPPGGSHIHPEYRDGWNAAIEAMQECAAQDSHGWQPIETAPDETPVWLCDASGAVWIGEYAYDGNGWYWTNTYMAVYYRQDGTWASSSADWDDDYQPTRWMPLPTAPNQEVKP